jgi:hypothetical protein
MSASSSPGSAAVRLQQRLQQSVRRGCRTTCMCVHQRQRRRHGGTLLTPRSVPPILREDSRRGRWGQPTTPLVYTPRPLTHRVEGEAAAACNTTQTRSNGIDDAYGRGSEPVAVVAAAVAVAAAAVVGVFAVACDHPSCQRWHLADTYGAYMT